MALGALLRERRERKGDSASFVAKNAEISPAYLYKLESDEVREPSPHVLHRLAEALDTPYADLMDAAGYLTPKEEPNPQRLSMALFGDLAEDEREELAAYLSWYRERKSGRTRKLG